jgi:ATP phosphoribosyltransferase regulatory subunit
VIARRDLLPGDYLVKENITNSLRKIIKENNFKFIMPPICEHHSVYENSRYKEQIIRFMFNNELIILRPDFTPSIARMLTTLKFTNGRIAYMGEVFRKEKDGIVELTQCGAEFIGDDETEENAINLLIDCISQCDIKEYSVDIGHSAVYRYISNIINLTDELSEELNKLVCRKSQNEIKEFCEKNNVDEDVQNLLLILCDFYEGEDQIDAALKYIDDNKIKEELENLRSIYKNIKASGSKAFIDLGIVKDFDYYTGIIFEAFVSGASKSVASGGRYDNLISIDDNNIKAVGFGINVDSLLRGGKNDDNNCAF